EKISNCAAFIFVTPEYNHSYPGVLKNAIDYLWEPWQKKPFIIVSYSPGAIGGARAAEQLRNLLNWIGLHDCGELNITFASRQFTPIAGESLGELASRLHKLFQKLIS
ncbi:MAG: hypothetical protein ACD_43C00018G0005, partial [uncultured bacterium]